MKNKIFSKGLYAESMRQLKVIGIIALVIFLVGAVMTPILTYLTYMSIDEYGFVYLDGIGMPGGAGGVEFVDYFTVLGSLSSLIFWVPIFALILFKQFNSRAASDFYHSLPYTRLCTYVSFALGALTWGAIIGVSYSAVSLGIHLCLRDLYVVSFAGMFDYVLTIIAATLVVTCGVICGMSLTGTPFSNIVMSALIVFGPRAILLTVAGVIKSLSPIMSFNNSFLSADFNVLFGMFTFTGDVVGNIGKDIYTIFIAIVYFVLGAYFFSRRKSETAGQTAGSKYLRDALRIAVTVFVSGVGTCLFITEKLIAPLVFFGVTAVVTYFVYELATTKRFKALGRTLPGLGIVLAINLLFAGICYGASELIYSYTPDADDIRGFYIKSVSDDEEIFYSYVSEYSLTQYIESRTGEILIEDDEAKQIICDSLKDSIEVSRKRAENIGYILYESNGTTETVKIVDKFGVARYRNIEVSPEDNVKLGNAIKNHEGYREAYMNLPEALERSAYVMFSEMSYYDSITREQSMQVYESLREEVKTVNFGEWFELVRSSGYYGEVKSSTVSISITVKENGKIITVPIDEKVTPKTYKLMLDLYNEGAEEKAALVEKYYNELDANDAEYNLMDITVYGVTENGEKRWAFSCYDIYTRDATYYDDMEELTAEIVEKVVEAARSGEEIENGEYISVYVHFGKEDEDGYMYQSKEFCFTVPYPEGFKVPQEYYFAE